MDHYRRRKRGYNYGDVIVERADSNNNYSEKKYRKLKCLGRGGFAKVYKVQDLSTKEYYALKMIDKKGLKKKSYREKLSSEIKIHSSLDYPFVCQFIRFFEDRSFVYLLLELCDCKTLMEVINSKKRLSDKETKYFMYQLIQGVVHMHDKRIIHRDLKLGNIFLDNQLNIKIGDFGLAAQLAYDGQRKRTLCGTPNYIAPEILMNARNGHSYEVDIWSIGVIFYTLLVGKPPFETRTVKDTYRQIKSVNYRFPSHLKIDGKAKMIIKDIFQKEPFKRPTVFELLDYDFFREFKYSNIMKSEGVLEVPKSLNTYVFKLTKKNPLPKDFCLTRKGLIITKEKEKGEKKIGLDHLLKKEGEKDVEIKEVVVKKRGPCNKMKMKTRKNKYDSWLYNKLEKSVHRLKKRKKKNLKKKLVDEKENKIKGKKKATRKKKLSNPVGGGDGMIRKKKMKDDIDVCFAKNEKEIENKPKNNEAPKIWVQDIGDYSSKYGLAYRYNNGIVGAFYNDYTMMLYNSSTGVVKYIKKNEKTYNKGGSYQEEEYNINKYPEFMKKKMILIKYFHQHFERSNGAMLIIDDFNEEGESEKTTDIFVKMYLKTKDAYVFRLSNRVVQVRFTDNSEIILSSEAKLVTYVSKYGKRQTFSLESVVSDNQDPSIAKRLRYTKNVLYKLINK